MLPLLTIVAVLVTAFVIRRFLDPRSYFYVTDTPNARSLHEVPVPRTGGVAVVLIFAVTLSITAHWIALPAGSTLAAIAVVVLAVIGFADDRRHVAPLVRLLTHMVAAGLLWISGWTDVFGSGVEFGGVVALNGLAALLVVWMINLYNFMDGMDGLAGGMGVIGFAALAVFGWIGGDLAYSAMAGLLAAACLGFLIFNYPPARIFMGDAGSTTLGFLAAALGFLGVREGLFAFWVPLLVFSPFVFDATWTLARRALKGEKVWQAHRSHLYQRLVLAGWGRIRTLWLYYALMFASALTCVVARDWGGGEVVKLITVWGLIYASLAFFVAWIERTRGPENRFIL